MVNVIFNCIQMSKVAVVVIFFAVSVYRVCGCKPGKGKTVIWEENLQLSLTTGTSSCRENVEADLIRKV